MRVQRALERRSKAVVMSAAAAICLAVATAGEASAQAPRPPPPASGAPSAGQGPTGFGTGGPVLFPKPEPSPAEKLVAALPPPWPGSMPPITPLPADAPMPSSNPRDLRGTWVHNQPIEFRIQQDMYGKPVPYNMAGAQVLARRVNSTAKGKPYTNASATCRPAGPQWQIDTNFPFQIFQSKGWFEFLFEEYHGRWQILFDPSAAPHLNEKRYMGRSIGHWKGDTLVVETKDFRQAIWLDLDGTPLSANGKIVQRIQKIDNGDYNPYLEIITTFFDSTYYVRPWSVVRTFGWQPELTNFLEYNCEEQVGDPNTRSEAGLIRDPE